MSPRPWRRAALLVALLLYATALCITCATDTEEKIVITTVTGETKEISREEFEAMQAQQASVAKENEWKERQRLEDIEREDPAVAQQIRFASVAFSELQRHGYARGYRLAGFTEKDRVLITTKAELKQGKRKEFQIKMQIRAELDKASGVKANPGTSAHKRDQEPTQISYDVEVLLDQNDGTSLVYAWEVGRDGRRGRRLSIKPSEAMLKRAKEKESQLGETATFARYMLAGGVTLIAIGAALVFIASQAPPSAPEKTKKKQTKPATSPKRLSREEVAKREAGDGWELAN
ncbi:hypothetical protein Poli38472_007058 [Pythium oligandrum]|uniref:Uncharacterized protein n=1 Tax=Pythium oligandrum TaxID=41045 RepID=A0A8K1CA20_PYTOL|nr:hypothetical protein Poli38472_007058 [Pythium oligandrum]|eukprot:TMW58913.1 hypothetical protein Poli38472_007058 [Pythium oligandrum]